MSSKILPNWIHNLVSHFQEWVNSKSFLIKWEWSYHQINYYSFAPTIHPTPQSDISKLSKKYLNRSSWLKASSPRRCKVTTHLKIFTRPKPMERNSGRVKKSNYSCKRWMCLSMIKTSMRLSEHGPMGIALQSNTINFLKYSSLSSGWVCPYLF